MNTTTLKRFAQSARRKLMDQVAAKMEFVLTTDSAGLREQAKQINELKKELTRTTREQLVERVAYTWFNRLAALRFMDANDYQPSGIRVVSPAEGTILPQVLNEAKQGNIPADWKVDTQKINDLLDGRIPSSNPQNEAYRKLLIAACNQLHSVFPFLFEAINDYSELLLPDDLTSDFSIVHDVVTGMSADDCQQVEVLGWLYQFYISEEKDRLINAKKKYKAHEIAPVTQLFTPHWIVRYMVDNTLGQLWKEMRPNSRLTDNLEFYIKPENESVLPRRELKSPEEITFFDPCGGSGHILTYAFDVYYKIYEEEGYNPSEIPALIISKNLFGADIDERAAQLAGFALMMKGRQYYRRFLKKPVMPNIVAYRNVENDPLFENAKVLGSLIQVDKKYVDKIKVDSSSLFGETNRRLKQQAELLARQYDVVVTNPPYLNSSSMETELKKYIDQNFKDTKSDLFASFVVQVSRLTKKEGLIGYISPYVWMFISSYEKLREYMIKNMTLSSLIQLEYNAFEPACVPVCTFTLRNEFVPEYKGGYIKLSEFRGHQNQAPRTLEAIQNPDCGWFYTASQTDFQKIPGSPIGYWITRSFFELFNQNINIGAIGTTRKGMVCGGIERFGRQWFEIRFDDGLIGCYSRILSVESGKKWFPYAKGGEFRKWYGNHDYFVNWENDGNVIRNTLHPSGTRMISSNYNLPFIFKEGITWTDLSSSKFAARHLPTGFLFDTAGPSVFVKNKKYLYYCLGLMNSILSQRTMDLINPTMHYLAGNVANLPFIFQDGQIEIIVQESILSSKLDWNSRETSWDFEKNELEREAGRQKPEDGSIKLEQAYEDYKKHCTEQFFQLHQNEEELNRQFIEIYGLQEELTPDVPLEEITILQQELDRKALAKLNKRLQCEPGTLKVLNYPETKLPFIAKEVMAQFISYAVGCM
ncbi:MAG: BREX-1 system adenine-specific DNA-methyltransferase PglX, partial [Bacteroidales bacterium]|nr:BREX-1 system adenine-specific DNA-methyltransferase PglX [Bacteroidales bacterium]